MKFRALSINIILLGAALLFAGGCHKSPESKKKGEESTVRLHIEETSDVTGQSGPVEVTRDKFVVNIDKEPFLTEADLLGAQVVETPDGGFAIQLVFDRHGSMLLDMKTSMYKGKRIVIMAQFPKTRWLAAPIIKTKIGTGVLVFTPDCTREEAERLVNGLTNVIAAAKRDSLFNP